MSSIKKIIRGTVNGGRFIPSDPAAFRLVFCAHENKEVEVVVQRKKTSRSLNQNSYYHGVVIQLLCEVTGYTPDEMHEAVKFKWLRLDKRDDLVTVQSTASLSTVEFENLMTEIRQWAAAELDCYIPLPNEVEI